MLTHRISDGLRRLVSRPRGSPCQHDLPRRTLVLLASPRSGSTWFADAIRCHPGVEYWPHASVYGYLGLSGRRYPRDLSNGPDATLEIEARPGLWERIPEFGVSDMVHDLPDRFLQEKYWIEKCHPEFFGFSTSAFVDNVGKLENLVTQVRLVCQVRDPESSLSSFLSYQERNPSWYPSIRGILLVTYMRRTYRVLLEFARQHRCPIIEYDDIIADLVPVLEELYCYLWPDGTQRERQFSTQVGRAAEIATSREKRIEASSSFLGRRTGPVQGRSTRHRDFFSRFSDEIAQCYSYYEDLLALKEE